MLDGVGDDGAAAALQAAILAVEFFDFFIDPIAQTGVHTDCEFNNFFGTTHDSLVIPSVQKRKRYENIFSSADPLLERMSSEILMG